MLIRAILCQYILIFVGTIGTGVFCGMNGAFSCALGGLCVAIPNTFLAGYLLMQQAKNGAQQPVALLIFEFLKLATTCLLFLLVAKLYSGLAWPAMLIGIAVGALSNFAMLFGKQRE